VIELSEQDLAGVCAKSGGVAVGFQTATGYIFIQHLIYRESTTLTATAFPSIMYDDPDIPGVRLLLFGLLGTPPLLPC
jgi:hypothetical protein